MKLHGLSLLATAALCSVFSGSAAAQSEGVVTGSGSVSLNRAPETMRVQIALFGRGTGIKEALEALKMRSDEAKKQLAEFGADKESLKLDAARVTTMQNNRMQQIEMILAQRRGKKALKKGGAPVIVTSTITAEFKLEAKEAEALLLAVHPLQEKIREADLAGTKEAEKLTPEQEELLEEAESNGYSYGGEEQKPGTPVFLFVSRIREEDHEKAVAEAYQKAKVQAAKLAKAAGGELGALKSLSDSDSSGEEYGEEFVYSGIMANYNAAAQRAIQLARAKKGVDAAGREAFGTDPGPLKLSVTVSASFDLKGAK